MVRAAALIIQENKVALIERRGSQRGAFYYVFPGGGVEEGESPAEAAVREVYEELGVRIVVQQLVARGADQGSTQFYFTAAILGGTFGTGRGLEMVGPLLPEAGTYTPVWMPIADLPRLPVYPPEVAALVVRGATDGWPAGPADMDRRHAGHQGPLTQGTHTERTSS